MNTDETEEVLHYLRRISINLWVISIIMASTFTLFVGFVIGSIVRGYIS